MNDDKKARKEEIKAGKTQAEREAEEMTREEREEFLNVEDPVEMNTVPGTERVTANPNPNPRTRNTN